MSGILFFIFASCHPLRIFQLAETLNSANQMAVANCEIIFAIQFSEKITTHPQFLYNWG